MTVFGSGVSTSPKRPGLFFRGGDICDPQDGNQLDGPPSEIVRDPRAAVRRARELAGSEGVVLATGSIYLVADLVRPESEGRASIL